MRPAAGIADANLVTEGKQAQPSAIAPIASSSVELFRLAALRPPKLALGALPVIPLWVGDPPAERQYDVFDAVSGQISDLTVTFNEGKKNVPLSKLDRELARRNDAWDPTEVADFIRDATVHRVKEVVATEGWARRRAWVHWLLINAFGKEGDVARREFFRPTSLLRICRLMALI